MNEQQKENFGIFFNSSHTLLTVEFAQKIAGYFGQDCSSLVHTYKESTEPKGYHGPTAEGVAAFSLSPWLCRKLGLECNRFFGRGSQHRACCEALRSKLN